MRKESFFLRTSKCEFEQTKVEYLGLVLDHDTVKPDPTKTSGLKRGHESSKQYEKYEAP